MHQSEVEHAKEFLIPIELFGPSEQANSVTSGTFDIKYDSR